MLSGGSRCASQAGSKFGLHGRSSVQHSSLLLGLTFKYALMALSNESISCSRSVKLQDPSSANSGTDTVFLKIKYLITVPLLYSRLCDFGIFLQAAFVAFSKLLVGRPAQLYVCCLCVVSWSNLSFLVCNPRKKVTKPYFWPNYLL